MLNTFPLHYIRMPYKNPCGDGRAAGEVAGEETLEAVVADLHTGGSVLYGRVP